MSNKQARGKQQVSPKKCNQKNIKVAANSNVPKKRKQPQKSNSKLGIRLQDELLPPEYILSRVFRKDGPPVGVEFDILPSHAFQFCNVKDSVISHRACQEKQRELKRQKTSKPTNVEDQITPPDSASFKHGMGKGLMTVWRLTNQEGNSVKKHGIGKDSVISHRACQEKHRELKRQKTSKPTNVEDQITPPDSASFKHGMGKGLMTVWRLTNQEGNSVKKHGIGKGLMTIQQLTNPGAVNLPTCVDSDHGAYSQFPPSTSQKPPTQGKKKSRRQQPMTRRLVNKVQAKKSVTRSKKVRCEQVDMEKQMRREICKIALVGGKSAEDQSQYAMLVDDEELELRELQEKSNPLTFCAHCAANRLHGCSLCKDLLSKFPPNSVRMKKPLHMQPWDSSPQLVKKLFKIFHFVSTYAVIIGIQSFTLDELAQAFIDKDSLLLGKLNIALLKLLLTGVEKELDSGLVSHISKNWKYRGLLQSVEHEDSVLKLWKKSLNSLTWIEILRQVLIATGFGSKRDASRKEPANKEAALMASYGLSPGTLKGELFSILSLEGNTGMKISELATYSSIVGLKLATTTDKVEQLISTMLSSDITLFEKISPSTYRLRINSVTTNSEDDESDLEDCGSVDDDPKDININDSGDSIADKDGQKNLTKNKDNKLLINSEIDESYPGEMWLLGLMEGEYSDLNIEEKLNALLALVDLLRAGSSIRMEEPASHSVPNVHHMGSGAKLKRSTAKQLKNECNQLINSCESDTVQGMQPVDSSGIISVIQEKSNSCGETAEIEDVNDLHPMQSIFLGSDRRYNRYWILLGPCNTRDPGHGRIYFESSEDGHWEVIVTEEDLANLISALDHRGRRECHLLSSFKKREAALCEAMLSSHTNVTVGQPAVSGESERSFSRDDSSSAVSDVDNLLGLHYMQHDNLASTSTVSTPFGSREQAKQKWCRLQQFDAWLWNSFCSALNSAKHGKKSFLDSLARCERCHDLYWRDEKHCRICHTTFELDFDLEERYTIHSATCKDDSAPDTFAQHKIFSSQLQSLKAAAYTLESSMPEGAMVGAWTKSAHNIWVKRLRRTSTLVQLLQVLSDFVGSINKGWVYESDTALAFDYDLDDIVASFASMPQTSSAVALWLVKLDLLIAAHLKQD